MNMQPPEAPIISLRSLFRWAIYGGIFWLLLNIAIVPMGMNMWTGFAKYGRIIDEQGNPVSGVVIVSAFRSAGGFHGASFGCVDRFVTQTNAAGEYEIPSNFGLMASPSHWGWGFAPYKPGWLRKGEDDPKPPGPYTKKTVVYARHEAEAPRPWKLEWTKAGPRQQIPDLVMHPSTLPPGERVEYLQKLEEAMTCQIDQPLEIDIAINMFREAWETACGKGPPSPWNVMSAYNLWNLVINKATGDRPITDELSQIFKPYIDRHDADLTQEESERICTLLKPIG